jgi:hypothetical protein
MHRDVNLASKSNIPAHITSDSDKKKDVNSFPVTVTYVEAEAISLEIITDTNYTVTNVMLQNRTPRMSIANEESCPKVYWMMPSATFQQNDTGNDETKQNSLMDAFGINCEDCIINVQREDANGEICTLTLTDDKILQLCKSHIPETFMLGSSQTVECIVQGLSIRVDFLAMQYSNLFEAHLFWLHQILTLRASAYEIFINGIEKLIQSYRALSPSEKRKLHTGLSHSDPYNWNNVINEVRDALSPLIRSGIDINFNYRKKVQLINATIYELYKMWGFCCGGDSEDELDVCLSADNDIYESALQAVAPFSQFFGSMEGDVNFGSEQIRYNRKGVIKRLDNQFRSYASELGINDVFEGIALSPLLTECGNAIDSTVHSMNQYPWQVWVAECQMFQVCSY